jgi:hypothetical protein
MIRKRENNAGKLFKEWASNFSEGLFVMLKVYGDETGTHDGSDVVALSGLIETPEYWEKFNRRWKGVLDKSHAKYFHYREFRECANTKPGDPYYGWPAKKRRKFILRLAMLVGESAVPSGGSYPIKQREILGIKNNPYEQTIRAFYESTIFLINVHWPNYADRVLFVFDKCSKREWTGPLHEIHAEYERKYPSLIGGMAFEDDKDPVHLALQAADLSAIHFRNAVREYIGGEKQIFDIGIIDFIVSKNQDVMFRNLPKEKTQKLIDDLTEHESFMRRNGFRGAYIPLKHFDFQKYGYQ